ncbi:hypothetical protein K2173_007455 [Erythroxylum novogranatense]|uniref:Uncharacterized protein n=1 Tax=Erythroxylum novogranatense TaxID=1862640 RepID=A0AAV8T6R6_9ROSI|nr:hypothetical protein K2173_007455 [Erythroxylum novogranatense]
MHLAVWMRTIQEKLSNTRTFDEWRKLEMFFKNVKRHEVAIVILYEFVPHAGKVLLRLLLLCTVGVSRSVSIVVTCDIVWGFPPASEVARKYCNSRIRLQTLKFRALSN